GGRRRVLRAGAAGGRRVDERDFGPRFETLDDGEALGPGLDFHVARVERVAGLDVDRRAPGVVEHRLSRNVENVLERRAGDLDLRGGAGPHTGIAGDVEDDVELLRRVAGPPHLARRHAAYGPHR